MNRTHNAQIHTALLTWAADVHISGRADGVWNMRKVLIYLAANAGTIQEHYNYGQARIQAAYMSKDLHMNLRTLYRALTRLEDQGLICNTSNYGYSREYNLLTDVLGNK